jgi:hypothetical protein
LDAGVHLISLIARDSTSDAGSNVVVVSYRVQPSQGFEIFAAALFGLACLGFIAAGAWLIWRWRCSEAGRAPTGGDASESLRGEAGQV